MRTDILTSKNQKAIREYVTKKFTTYKSWTYSKATRRKKCRQYYEMAESEGNGQIVKDVYMLLFHEALPPAPPQKKSPLLVSPDDWLEHQEDRIARTDRVLKTLQMWHESGSIRPAKSSSCGSRRSSRSSIRASAIRGAAHRIRSSSGGEPDRQHDPHGQ